MIAAELRGGGKPSLNEALGWIGSRVEDVFGSAIGRLEDVWIDPATGEPRWLLVKEGRFGGRSTLVPFDQATPGEDTVWIPYERSVVREAPQIEAGVPLTQQVEATLRNHYAANAAAAVAHGYQSAGDEAGREGRPDSRATSATVRLATAGSPEPPPEPIPPPQLPLRPAPPIDAPPGPERREEPYGYEPAAEAQPPPPAPIPPPRQPGVGYRQPAAPGPAPAPQWPSGQPAQQAPRQQPPQAYDHEPPVPAQPPPQPQQQPYGYEPRPSAPVAPPGPGAGAYQPPPVRQVPPPPFEPDPLDVLAGLPPGHMVEIELSGSLTISGELRHARVIPPGDRSSGG
ncbi:MAG: hypothetical protein BroJett022_05740 [Actinomycetes bacterium]|nr:MAG: hypothetical protein BroJett022_05740 [Actinomycetes bacterium]